MSSVSPQYFSSAEAHALPDGRFMELSGPRTEHRTVAQIAADAGVAPDALPGLVAETAIDLLNATAHRESINNDYSSEINLLYSLYYALPREETTPELTMLGQNLSSFEQFINTYGPDRTAQELRTFVAHIGRFMRRDIGNERIRHMSLPPHTLRPPRHDYGYRGTWAKIWDRGDAREYADRAIVDEARYRRTQENIPQNHELVFHATGSAALHGIAEQNALLCATEALARA